MRKRINDFNCIEMKDQLQKQLMEEYEANKAEYDSVVDFINKKAEQSDLMAVIKSKLKQVKNAA